ncbi:phage antirepressor KilAC domain-containing protein [Alicyclobacillus acidoterrestris]|uniref:phage antirepressor KilAC domain-containing protein n=1 Tax=Alicyclobacillus TaxID=29330 RepID=UPI001A9070AC|nr:phage antirepressor KilAC domain-containing protein [Alicyclobacillus suci]
MNDLMNFDFSGRQLRVIVDGPEPWFVAKDATEILEHTNTAMALKGLDDDEKGVKRVYTLGGYQEMAVVSEPGLYKLILRSHKKQAKPFQRWVTHDVLPSIRKHGAYMTPEKIEQVLLNPDTIIQLATQLKEEREAKQKLEAQIEADKPKVVFAEAFVTSDDLILVRDFAKILHQNGINIGEKRLFIYLRDNGYLIKQKGSDWNMPTQKSMDLGLFEIKDTLVHHNSGRVTVNKTPKLTTKGQFYFINHFKKKMVASDIEVIRQ